MDKYMFLAMAVAFLLAAAGAAVVVSALPEPGTLGLFKPRQTDSAFTAKCAASGFTQGQCYFFRNAEVLPAGANWPD